MYREAIKDTDPIWEIFRAPTPQEQADQPAEK